MKRKDFLSVLFLVLSLGISAQYNRDSKAIFLEADYNYLMQDYQKAIALFENLLSADPGNSNLNFLCGNCCLKLHGSGEKAITYLEKAVQGVSSSYKRSSYKERNAPAEAYSQLARAYHINGDYDKAIRTYEIYRDSTDLKKLSDVEFVNRQIKSCELARHMVASPKKVRFQHLLKDTDQAYSKTNPVVSGNDSLMIFVGDQPLNKAIMMMRRQGGGWSLPHKINYQLGATGNFFPVSLSFDGTVLYLVQQDYFDSEIFVSRHSKYGWSRVEKLNKHINTKYYETHACESRDGRSLFFTSDRKGGFGGLDIYRSDLDSDGSWGEAVNLGPVINTIYNEESPFITKHDSKLYFSSQGHQTMGGFDIFSAEKVSDNSWSIPENIGYPVNTSGDDLFYNPGWNDGCGYYSWGTSEIASRNIKIIHILPEEATALAAVEEVKENIIFKEVSIEEPREGSLDKAKEESPGEAKEPDSEVPPKNSPEIDPGLSKTGAYITLNNILFDFNDYSLTKEAIREVERLYEVMNDNENVTIELTGHTDSKGSSKANLRLSRQRAQSVANYLTGRGITAERITVKGSGESSPVAINEFSDGSDAPKGRLFNRYTSIKINNLPDEQVQVAEMMVPESLKPVRDQSYMVVLTENNELIKKMPEEFFGRSVDLVKKGNTHFYIAAKFERKAEAVSYLNEAIDYGFPEARILESGELTRVLGSGNQEGSISNFGFTIQIMALKRSRDVSYFSDLGLVIKYAGEDGLNRYTYGKYENRNDAERELLQVRKQGYKNAFVVSASRFAETAGEDGPSAIMTYNL